MSLRPLGAESCPSRPCSLHQIWWVPLLLLDVGDRRPSGDEESELVLVVPPVSCVSWTRRVPAVRDSRCVS